MHLPYLRALRDLFDTMGVAAMEHHMAQIPATARFPTEVERREFMQLRDEMENRLRIAALQVRSNPRGASADDVAAAARQAPPMLYT